MHFISLRLMLFLQQTQNHMKDIVFLFGAISFFFTFLLFLIKNDNIIIYVNIKMSYIFSCFDTKCFENRQ